MRILLGLVVVALLVGVAMPTQGQSTTTVDFSGAGKSVDLIQNAGGTVQFRVADDQFGNEPSAALVTLTCTEGIGAGECPDQETLVVGLVKNGATWVGQISVDNKDLVIGVWDVVATGQSSTSTAKVPSSGSYKLTVTAPNVAAPTLRALNVDPDSGIVSVAKGQQVGVGIDSQLLRRVSFQIDEGAALSWGDAPYTLAASNFVPTGLHTLKVIAEDRLGQEREISVKVYADSNDPNVAHNIPARMFLGVPNKVPLEVTDDSNVTVTARLGTQEATLTGLPGKHSYAPMVTPMELGSQLLEVRVEDVVGNLVRIVQAVDVVPLETDLELVSVKQTDGGAIINENVRVTIVAKQRDGIVAVPVNVTFAGKTLGSFDVAVSGTTTYVASFRLPAGVHTGNLSLVVPAEVNELNPLDNSKNTTVEQFMARVIFRNDLFHIRAAASGLPDVAVGADGKTYPLTLQDRGLGTVYAFEVDGAQLFWNPASLVTTVSDPEQIEGEGEGNGIPGLPVVALIAALAAIGALRRRSA